MLAYLENTVAIDIFGHCVKKSRDNDRRRTSRARDVVSRASGKRPPGTSAVSPGSTFPSAFSLLNITLRNIGSFLPEKKF